MKINVRDYKYIEMSSDLWNTKELEYKGTINNWNAKETATKEIEFQLQSR